MPEKETPGYAEKMASSYSTTDCGCMIYVID